MHFLQVWSFGFKYFKFLSSINSVDNQDGGCKVLSRYFSKIASEMPIPYSLGK